MKEKLFGGQNIKKIVSSTDFKEDSVREVIILPILKELGYSDENIIRSKTLHHPFLKIGSKKRPVTLVPDYVLKVGDSFACVLDAKAPNQNIVGGQNAEQAYSYATHPEIRSPYFALCNGAEFSLYRTSSSNIPILYFNMEDIDTNWDKLRILLSPDSFQSGKRYVYEEREDSLRQFANFGNDSNGFDYANRPLLEEIPVRKRAAKRHHGVHPYFTSQSWNVVAEYIKNFSRPGDLVLDPFGGKGVTAIESLMNGRRAINIDLNPMAIFMLDSLVAPVKQSDLIQAFEEVRDEYVKKEPKTEEEIKKAIKKYPGPKKLSLPKGSDVDTVDQLFSHKQLAQLSLLKSIIKKQKDENIKKALMLMFSGLISENNLMAEGDSNATVMKYYRYRIAPRPKTMDLINYFETRFKRILAAKKEIEYFINDKTISNVQIIKDTAVNLSFLHNESIDYIYTDPPYGKKIPYLDLSVMWNAWLDLEVTQEDYKQEAIEGGEHHKSKEDYNSLIAQSIKEMYRVLKFDRWLSFVFAHKDPEFWHLIIDTAESCGFEYIGATPQKNGHSSFKKIQNPFTVLSGQLIINFRKVKNPKVIMKANLGMDISDTVMQTIEAVIAKNNGATLEQINDELIIKGLELGFLDLLKKEYSDITPLLLESFDYNEDTEIFSIKKNSRFQTHIDVKLRIRYYLISFLTRMERENKVVTFDEIVMQILPLLKNGTTPEHQTILSVLESLAQRVGDNGWKLKQSGQLLLDGMLTL
jgi:DNA modification methylase